MTVDGLVEGGGRLGIGAAHLGAGLFGREHPDHARAGGISFALPGGDLALELGAVVDAPIQALSLEHADLDLDHVEPARVLGRVMELQPPQDAVCLRGRKGLVERAPRVGGEIVLDDPDALGFREVHVDELAQTLGIVLPRAPLGHAHLAPRPVRIHGHEQVERAVAAVLVIDAPDVPRRCRDRLAHLADQLNGALVEADHRTRRIRRLGVEIEHVLHAGHVLAIDLRHAPHLLAPRLELVLGQAPAHGLAREAAVIGEAHHLAGEELDGPASPALGRAGACGGDQQRFLVAGQLALGTGTGLLGERLVEIAFHEAAPGPVDGRAADAKALGYGVVRQSGIGCEQDLSALELAGRMPAAAQQRLELDALGFAQVDPVAYVHRASPLREAQMNRSRGDVCENLHRPAGSVPGLHRCLHPRDRPTSGRERHPAPLRGQPAVRAPDGAHAGAARAHPPPAGGGAQHRGAPRPRAPARAMPPRTRQILCAEELVRSLTPPARRPAYLERGWSGRGSLTRVPGRRDAVLEAKLDALRELLEAERRLSDELRADRDAWREQAGRLALPAPVETRRSWWRRLRAS